MQSRGKTPYCKKTSVFYNGYKPGGGSNPVIKKFVPLLFCSVGRLKTGRKTTENRQKLPKTARKTTETGTNFYKKRPGGWGSKAFYKNYKKTDVFLPDRVPKFGNAIHTQIRLNCSQLNSHLYSFGLSSTPYCLCQAQKTTKHFLLECFFVLK